MINEKKLRIKSTRLFLAIFLQHSLLNKKMEKRKMKPSRVIHIAILCPVSFISIST